MNNLFTEEITTIDELQNNWRDQYLLWWAFGMPSYDQQETAPWKQINIKFRTREDREHFDQLLQYGLTDKTNAVWYPKKDRDPNSKSRYVEDGYDLPILDKIEEDEAE